MVEEADSDQVLMSVIKRYGQSRTRKSNRSVRDGKYFGNMSKPMIPIQDVDDDPGLGQRR